MTVIDKTVRNKWSWKWTEKLVDGTILDLTLGECIRKLPRAGLAVPGAVCGTGTDAMYRVEAGKP